MYPWELRQHYNTADFTKKVKKKIPDELHSLSWYKSILVRIAEVTIANGKQIMIKTE